MPPISCYDGETQVFEAIAVAGGDIEYLYGVLLICYNEVFLPVCNTTNPGPSLLQTTCAQLGYNYAGQCVGCAFFTGSLNQST